MFAAALADEIALCNLAVIGTILAQSDRGTSRGAVSDAAAAVVAGAQLEINNAETGPSIKPLALPSETNTVSACVRLKASLSYMVRHCPAPVGPLIF
jgi:hypothetical protein